MDVDLAFRREPGKLVSSMCGSYLSFLVLLVSA